MLDVLHFYLEEDLTYADEKQAEVKSATRTRIYTDFYEKEYKYGYKSSSQETSFEYIDDEEQADNPIPEINVFNPRKQAAKPFIPTTDFDGAAETPYGSILDAPLK